MKLDVSCRVTSLSFYEGVTGKDLEGYTLMLYCDPACWLGEVEQEYDRQGYTLMLYSHPTW